MKSFFKTVRYKLTTRHKNNKFIYYFKNFARLLVPRTWHQHVLLAKLSSIAKFNVDYVYDRVNYYCKQGYMTLDDSSILLKKFRPGKKLKVYFFDTHEYTRYFPTQLKISFLFGDITSIPGTPTIVKSRPISVNNSNSVLLNLDKVRHFIFVKDRTPFQTKKDQLVGRSVVRQPHRILFYSKYFDHPMCNLGQTNLSGESRWLRDYMTIEDQLQYKFILCLEGNDVASNLKWVMSSNSLAVMPQPKYETWFMEGRLVGGQHYVQVRDDYSDLEEKLQYYMDHPQESLEIIRNANHYVRQFQDKEQEDLISLLVLTSYFEKTGQLQKTNSIHAVPKDRNSVLSTLAQRALDSSLR